MMKTILRAHKVLLLISTLTISVHALANDEDLIEKRKTYSKTYSVSSSDRISLTNQFGEMRLNGWDKNEVKVDVTIIAKAHSDERAQEILEDIEIEDGKNSSGVYFKTRHDEGQKRKSNKGKYSNEGFQINYVVYLPTRNPLDLSNSFGSTFIPDYSGAAEIESKFGSLEAGNLSNAKSVSVEFGKAKIKGMNGGKLEVKFSKAEIDRVSGTINAFFEHSGGIKLGLDNSIKGLTVKNSFTELYLDVPKDLSANFDINTNFGDFSNKTGFDIRMDEEDEDQHGPKFDHRYRGKSGSGSVAMKIRSEFGKVIVGHNLSVDLSDDDDKKNKKKVKDI